MGYRRGGVALNQEFGKKEMHFSMRHRRLKHEVVIQFWCEKEQLMEDGLCAMEAADTRTAGTLP